MKIEDMEHTGPENETRNIKKDFLATAKEEDLADLVEIEEVDEELGDENKGPEIPNEELAEEADLREWMSDLRDDDAGTPATVEEVKEHKSDPVEYVEDEPDLVENNEKGLTVIEDDGYVSVPLSDEAVRVIREKLKAWPFMENVIAQNVPPEVCEVDVVNEGPDEIGEELSKDEVLDGYAVGAIDGEATEEEDVAEYEKDPGDDPVASASPDEVKDNAKDTGVGEAKIAELRARLISFGYAEKDISALSQKDVVRALWVHNERMRKERERGVVEPEAGAEMNAEFAKRFPNVVEVMSKGRDELTSDEFNVLRAFIRAQGGIDMPRSNADVYVEAQGFFRDNAGKKPPKTREYVAPTQQPPVVETHPPVVDVEGDDGMDEVVGDWLASGVGKKVGLILGELESGNRSKLEMLRSWMVTKGMEDETPLEVMVYVGGVIEEMDTDVERVRQRDERANRPPTPPPPPTRPERNMFVMPETPVTDEDLVKFRNRMIERIDAIENMRMDKESTWGHLNVDFARIMGLSSMRFEDGAIEAKLKAEFMARIELNAVGLYWENVRSSIMSSEDSYYDVMKKSMSGCPILSVGTYDWLRSQEGYKTIENGHGVETLQLTQEIDLSIAEIYRRMTALKPAVGAVDERLDLWMAGEDENMRTVEQIATRLGVSEGSVKLAWSLVEAECWSADIKGTHPAYKVCSFSKSRIENYKAGLGVSAGIRLVQEYREAHPRVAKGDIPDSVFEVEGVSWARTGLRAWPKAELAARTGKYLTSMSEYVESSGVKISPQALVMEGFGFGVAAHDVLDGIVGAKLGESSSSAFGGITGKLFLSLMRVEAVGSVNAGGPDVAPQVGKLLNQWVRSYLWGESWANEEVNDTNGMKNFPPTEDLFAHFQDLITAYDADADEGVVVGSGQGSEQSKKDAVEFVQWFGSLQSKLMRILGNSKLRSGIPKNIGNSSQDRRTNDMFGLASFQKDYWLGKNVLRMVQNLVGRGTKDDPRWWL